MVGSFLWIVQLIGTNICWGSLVCLFFFFLGIQVQFSDDMNHYPGKHQKLLLQLSCFAGFNKEVLPSTSSS